MTHERTRGTSGMAKLADDDPRLHLSVINNLDDLAELTPQWERLLTTSPNATEFNTPVAAMTWFRWFSSSTNGVHAVAAWLGDELVGLALFSVTRLPLVGFRLLNTPGAEHSYYGEPLLGPEPKRIATMFAGHIAKLVRSGTAVVHFRRLASNGDMANALDNHPAISCHQTGEHTRSVVRFDLIADSDQYFARLARKHQIPRRTRRLAEHFSHVEHMPHDPEPEAALDAMREMTQRRFGQGNGPEIFSSPAREAFVRALVREMARAGWARVSSLMADGRRIVVSLDFCVNSRTFSYSTAYDPDLARFSLGNLELFEALRHAHSSGATEVDLGSTTFGYKEQWANSSKIYKSITVTAPGRRGRWSKDLGRAAMSYRARRIYSHPPALDASKEGT